MSTVGSLLVNMTGQSASFDTTIAKSAKAVHGLGEESSITSELFGKFVEGLGVGSGIAAVETGLELVKAGFEFVAESIEKAIDIGIEWTKQTMEQAESAVALSKSLGYSTEAIQGLQQQAKHLGIDSQTVNNGLSAMALKVTELSQQGGPAAATLAKLGINVKDLAQQSGDARINSIADALHNISDGGQRAFVAQELMSKGGKALLPILSEGSEALAEFRKQGLATGSILSSMDSSKLLAAKEQAAALEDQFQGLKNQLAIELAPTIFGVAQSIRTMLPPASAVKAVIAEAIQYTGVFATIVSSWALQAVGYMTALEGRIQGIASVLSGGLISSDGANTLEKAGTSLQRIGEMLPDAAMAKFAQVSKDFQKGVEETQKSINDAINGTKALADTSDIDKYVKAYNELQKAVSSIGGNEWSSKIAGLSLPPDLVKQYDDLIGKYKELKAQAEGQKKVEEDLKRLRTEEAELGMSEAQKQLYALQEAGASAAQIAEATRHQQAIDNFNEEKKAWDDMFSEKAKTEKSRLAGVVQREFTFDGGSNESQSQQALEEQKKATKLSEEQVRELKNLGTVFAKVQNIAVSF